MKKQTSEIEGKIKKAMFLSLGIAHQPFKHNRNWEERIYVDGVVEAGIQIFSDLIQGEKKKWKEEMMKAIGEYENIYNGEVQKDGSRLYTVDPQRVKDRNKFRYELYQELRKKLEEI